MYADGAPRTQLIVNINNPGAILAYEQLGFHDDGPPGAVRAVDANTHETRTPSRGYSRPANARGSRRGTRAAYPAALRSIQCDIYHCVKCIMPSLRRPARRPLLSPGAPPRLRPATGQQSFGRFRRASSKRSGSASAVTTAFPSTRSTDGCAQPTRPRRPHAANTYTHVLADETELELEALLRSDGATPRCYPGAQKGALSRVI